MEDYALLMGSIGLFAVLSLVMYLTRSINCYGVTLTDENRNLTDLKEDS